MTTARGTRRQIARRPQLQRSPQVRLVGMGPVRVRQVAHPVREILARRSRTPGRVILEIQGAEATPAILETLAILETQGV
jgi:hypothetical protein